MSDLLHKEFAEGRVRFLSHAVGYLLGRKEQETEEGIRDAFEELAQGLARVALMVSPQYAVADVRKASVVERILGYAADACEADSRETYGSDVEFEDWFGGDRVRLAAAYLMLNRVSWHRKDDEYVFVTAVELLEEGGIR